MTDLHPQVRTILSLLLMLNRRSRAKAWVAISMSHPQHDVAQFLRPLTQRALEGSRPAARSLATEVLEAFTDLDEATLGAIGGALFGRSDGDHPEMGHFWTQQLTAAALKARHELMPKTLEGLFAHW